MGSSVVLRCNLDDKGKTQNRARYYSPDMITHKLVQNPLEYFTDCYAKDPNMEMEPENINFVYMRAKNYGDTASAPQYANLYVNDFCLYNNPANWEKNRVQTVNGRNYSELGVIEPGKVAVTNDYFRYEPKTHSGRCCFVGTVGSEKNPDYKDINTWQKYVNWLDTNPGVATRNMIVSRNYQVKDFEDLVNIGNIGQKAAMLFVVKGQNLPDKTTFGIKCDAIPKLSQEQVYLSSDEDSHEFMLTVYIPANFDNYLTVYGILSSGHEWPDNAVILVSSSIVQTRASIAQFPELKVIRPIEFHHDIMGIASPKDAMEDALMGFYDDDIKLGIPIGSCGHTFIVDKDRRAAG